MNAFRRVVRLAGPAAMLLALLACATGPDGGAGSIPSGIESGWRDGPVVMTRFGAIRGEADADATWVWRGVPYARPPTGELRWRAPRDPEPWTGVRDTRRFAAPSLQFLPLLSGSVTGSEDCLYLNVWRPHDAEADLPVYVWIHGGGNSMGGASYVPDYYGNRLASTSRMVFVSVTYRLGPLGWFYHPALAEGESREDGSGNYGTLDLIQALRWVRDNIRAFGGDPGRVLIAGESAGGTNVLSLMISPLARRLFSAAMVESGAATSRPLDEALRSSENALARLLLRDRKARSLALALELARAMPAADVRAYLRKKSARDILRPYAAGALGMTGNPAILRDGKVLPADGFAALARGEYAQVPLVIGSNKEETKLFLFFDAKIRRDAALYRAVARWGSDRWKAEGVDGIARRLTASLDRPPVFAYQFAWGAPDEKGRSPLPGRWGELLGSFHSLEIPFFLGTDTIEGKLVGGLLFTPANAKGRKALSAAMMRYVATFARTGDPNAPDGPLPRWDPWSNETGAAKCIVFDATDGAPDIRMTDTDLTSAGVDDEMRRTLPADLYAKAVRYAAASHSTMRPD